MMKVLSYLATFMGGGIFGVVWMCLFQINRHDYLDIPDKKEE